MKKEKKVRFEIHIGDWSDDGHGKMSTFTVNSNLSLKEVREAYFKAKKKLSSDLDPESFANEYEDNSIPEQTRKKAKAAGYTLPSEDEGFGPEDMFDYLLWFIQQGNKDLKLKQEKPLDSLSFYGDDEKGRHIDFIGYGLF
jgi:hypothetical protein